MNKAIFLDRDGTINQLKAGQKYICNTEDVKLNKNVKETLKKLKKLGYKLIVITNQTGVGVGYYAQEQAEKVNNEIEKQLGFKFDAIYSCYHHPDENCNCRKPKIENIQQAIDKFNIDVKKSYFVGDKEKDIQTGKNAGCKGTILIGNKNIENYKVKPDFIVKDFKEILDFIS